jgi:hypothetical protein
MDPAGLWEWDIDRLSQYETVTDANGRVYINYLMGPDQTPGTETIVVNAIIDGEPTQLEITVTRL